MAAVLADDLAELDRGVRPAGKASVEAPDGTRVKGLLSYGVWGTGEPWTPLRLALSGPVGLTDLRVDVVTTAEQMSECTAVHRSTWGPERFTDQRWQTMAAGSPFADGRCLLGRDNRSVAVATTTVWSPAHRVPCGARSPRTRPPASSDFPDGWTGPETPDLPRIPTRDRPAGHGWRRSTGGMWWAGVVQWETHPVTPDRFEDFADVVNGTRRTSHCWCLSHRLQSAEVEQLGSGSREAAMRRLCEREHPPGVVTYLDGEPVGWCNIGPRAEITRLARSRLIRPVDDVPVWSIVCVVVRPGHRRCGVTAPLLDGAVAYAASRGAPAVEAHPVDPPGRMDTTMAFVGTKAMFERVGFRVVGTTDATAAGLPRLVMRRDLLPDWTSRTSSPAASR